jgi:hypothetical protein
MHFGGEDIRGQQRNAATERRDYNYNLNDD